MGTEYGVVARWLAPNPETRIAPSPAACRRIAQVFERKQIEVFIAAGYIDDTDKYVKQDPDWEQDIRALANKLKRVMRTTPPELRGLIRTMTDVHIDLEQKLINDHVSTQRADGASEYGANE
jgi:hypothetical protein